MIPWKLTTELNHVRQLFSEVINVDYIVNTFICDCGHIDFLLGYQSDEIEYICPLCKNKTFYDANLAWRNIDLFLNRYKNIKLDNSFDVFMDDNKISTVYSANIPKNIDFLRKKTYFKRKNIYTLNLFRNAVIKEEYKTKKDKDIFQKLKILLIKQLNSNYCHFNLPDPQDKIFSLDNMLFFLKNPHLKEFDFYFWESIEILPKKNIDTNQALKIVSNHRKEKSIIKSVYKNYYSQMKENYTFSPSLIKVFTKEIKDPNILCRLLELDIYRVNFTVAVLTKFIKMLKQRYSEKQIASLFTELADDYCLSNIYYFRDMVYVVIEIDDFFIEYKNLKCNMVSLHDTAVEHRRKTKTKRLSDIEIFNTTYKQRACVKIDEYHIKLPKDGKELYQWAETLHNCMNSYLGMILNDKTTIYGFFIDNKIDFAVEISDGKLRQASRAYNQSLLVYQKDILKKWLNRYLTIS